MDVRARVRESLRGPEAADDDLSPEAERPVGDPHGPACPRKRQVLIEVLIGPVHECGRVGKAPPARRAAEHAAVEPQPALHGGAKEGIAGLDRAGLDADKACIGFHEIVCRVEGPLRVTEGDRVRARANRLRDEGIVLEGVLAHLDEVGCRGVVVGLHEAMGVGEVGVSHADLARLVVHRIDERVLGARDGESHVVRRIVCGEDEHDHEELAEGERVSRLDARDLRITLVADLREGADVIEALAGVERDHGRHDLCDGCGVHLLVLVAGKEGVASRVDDLVGLGLAWLRFTGTRTHGRKGKAQRQGEHHHHRTVCEMLSSPHHLTLPHHAPFSQRQVVPPVPRV